MLHYKARAKTIKAKVLDILLIIFGCAAAVYTTVQTVRVRFSIKLSLYLVLFNKVTIFS